MRRVYLVVVDEAPWVSGDARAFRCSPTRQEVEEIELSPAAESAVQWHLGDSGPHRDVWEGATLVDPPRANDPRVATRIWTDLLNLQLAAERGDL